MTIKQAIYNLFDFRVDDKLKGGGIDK